MEVHISIGESTTFSQLLLMCMHDCDVLKSVLLSSCAKRINRVSSRYYLELQKRSVHISLSL